MSGLVRTYSPWSRVHSRISGVESPSWVEDLSSGRPDWPNRRSVASWSWASAFVGAR